MKNFFLTIVELIIVGSLILLIKYFTEWNFNDRELLILFFALYMQLQMVSIRGRTITQIDNYYIDTNEIKENDEFVIISDFWNLKKTS
jgi:hypothetical protein